MTRQAPASAAAPRPLSSPPAPPVWRRSSSRTRWRRAGLLAIAAAVAMVIVVPIYFGIIGGFKDNAQLSTGPLSLPSPWRLSNYGEVLGSGTFWRQVFNSTFVGFLTVLITVGVAALAAYVFARFAFRGRETLFMLFAAGLMFPPAVAILPLFVLLRELDLLNSPWGIILPQSAFALPLTIIILRTFFRTIPAEIEESATLDGASTFGIFWRIMLPMARPALAVVSVLALVTSWNNFLLPLVVLNREQSWWTLPLGVMQFTGQWASETARILAYVMLAMVPALAFFFFAERQIVAGIAPSASGTKG
jgi:raffinose/stachyose/melibiose transport system permease protein